MSLYPDGWSRFRFRPKPDELLEMADAILARGGRCAGGCGIGAAGEPQVRCMGTVGT
jgi:hypothetical protein